MTVTGKQRVNRFLEKVRALASNRERFYFVARRVKYKTPLALGLQVDDCRREIIDLTVENYSRGPEPDFDREGEIWVFGKQIEGVEVYIKLKIFAVINSDGTREEFVKCISFHEAESALRYPYSKR